MQQLISKAAELTKKTMAGVKTSQFDDPTPCSDFNVKALTNHIAGLAMGSELAAKKQPRVGSPEDMPDRVRSIG